MKISSRQVIKIAGEAEAKRSSSLNFDYVNKVLTEQDPSSVFSRDLISLEIQKRLGENGDLAISKELIDKIRVTNLSESNRRRVNKNEAYLLIVGACLSDNTEQAIGDIEWYLEYAEVNPGSFSINSSSLTSLDEIKVQWDAAYQKILNLKREVERKKEESSDSYKSDKQDHDFKHEFGDGWKVVYVPAVGEMEPYPGIKDSSHDRILEGNKNGLCLGSNMRHYQDNEEGKIYSIRDPENKPRVTVRIQDKTLREAKGKNNNPPDIEGALHAVEWFESIDDLDYKSNDDFKSFPPTNREAVQAVFEASKEEPYQSGWISHWYKKGIQEIDEDVVKRVMERDPLIFQSGMGKQYFELVKPVVEHWCKQYLEGRCGREVLFGGSDDPPTHEVFKTYRKLDLMRQSVEKLSKEDPMHYFQIGLQEIAEYDAYSEVPIRTYAEKNPGYFLNSFTEKPWAVSYIDVAAKACAEREPFGFLRSFSEKPWAATYIDSAAEICAKTVPYNFLEFLSKKPWAAPYIDTAAEICVRKYHGDFLENFSEMPWAKKQVESIGGRTWREVAAEICARKDPVYFLENFSEKPWAAPYIDVAAKAYVEEDLESALEYFTIRPWANKRVESIGGMTWKEFAQRRLAERNLKNQKNASQNPINTKLTKLAKALKSLGLHDDYVNIISLYKE